MPADTFSLSAQDILIANDKDLNEYVSLKKLAPYRKTGARVWDNKRATKLRDFKEKLKSSRWAGSVDQSSEQHEATHKKKRKGKKERERAKATANTDPEPAHSAAELNPDVQSTPRKRRKTKTDLGED